MDDSIVLKTVDVPQADSLPTIRRVVEALADGDSTNAQLKEKTGFSHRHIQYRFQAARVLGFVKPDHLLTEKGQRLIKTSPGSEDELQEWRTAVENSAVVRAVIPDLLNRSHSIDKDKLAKRLMILTGLSEATAKRRARVLKAWARQLARNSELR